MKAKNKHLEKESSKETRKYDSTKIISLHAYIYIYLGSFEAEKITTKNQ